MIRDFDELTAIFQKVSDVTAWQMPPEASSIVETIQGIPSPRELLEAAKNDLAAAIESGDPDAIRAAHKEVAALGDGSVLLESLEAHKTEAAVRLLKAARDDAWAHVAARYRALGAELAANLEAIDPDTKPEAVAVTESKKKREAWARVPDRVRELDALERLLVELLRACRWSNPGAHYRDRPEYTAALLTRTPSEAVLVLRRDPSGRAGRWGALLAAGIPLETLEDPREYQALEASAA